MTKISGKSCGLKRSCWEVMDYFAPVIGGNGMTSSKHQVATSWSRKHLGVVGIPKSFVCPGFALSETPSFPKVPICLHSAEILKL